MAIDAATRRNLELVESLTGGRNGTLLATIDRTETGGGGRLILNRLTAPSTCVSTIHERLASVEFFLDTGKRDRVTEALKPIPDIERALSRLALDRGGPRDLAALRDGLENGRRILSLCQMPICPTC